MYNYLPNSAYRTVTKQPWSITFALATPRPKGFYKFFIGERLSTVSNDATGVVFLLSCFRSAAFGLSVESTHDRYLNM